MVQVRALLPIEYRLDVYKPGELLEVNERLAQSWSANGVAEIIGPVEVEAAPVVELEQASADVEGETPEASAPKPKRRRK